MDENDLRETPNHRLFSISLQKDILDLHPRAGGMGWTTPCLPHEAGESNNQTNGEYLPYYPPLAALRPPPAVVEGGADRRL